MLCGNDMASRSNQTVITNKNIGIIHKTHIEIENNIFPDMDIFKPPVCIDWRDNI